MGVGSILLPCLDDLFLERILKVILEGTFDEVIAQLNELHLVNTNWNETTINHPYWFPQFHAI